VTAGSLGQRGGLVGPPSSRLAIATLPLTFGTSLARSRICGLSNPSLLQQRSCLPNERLDLCRRSRRLVRSGGRVVHHPTVRRPRLKPVDEALHPETRSRICVLSTQSLSQQRSCPPDERRDLLQPGRASGQWRRPGAASSGRSPPDSSGYTVETGTSGLKSDPK
jgi:hypothetical protein